MFNHIPLAVGKNFAATAHIDNDSAFTFRLGTFSFKFRLRFIIICSGIFSTKQGKVGNSFCFPQFEVKIGSHNDHEQLQLFMFNPCFEVFNCMYVFIGINVFSLKHCAEKLIKPPGGDSFSFSLYTSAVVVRYLKSILYMHCIIVQML